MTLLLPRLGGESGEGTASGLGCTCGHGHHIHMCIDSAHRHKNHERLQTSVYIGFLVLLCPGSCSRMNGY